MNTIACKHAPVRGSGGTAEQAWERPGTHHPQFLAAQQPHPSAATSVSSSTDNAKKKGGMLSRSQDSSHAPPQQNTCEMQE
eukprot:841986-Pelagomonas_calceolata.AAC.2